MPYIEMTRETIDTSIIYVSPKELMERTGTPKSTLHRHIVVGLINAIRFNNRTFFTKEEADRYEALSNSNLL